MIENPREGLGLRIVDPDREVTEYDASGGNVSGVADVSGRYGVELIGYESKGI